MTSENLVSRYAKELRERFAPLIPADRPVAFELDGDYLGERESVTFRSIPNALQVLV